MNIPTKTLENGFTMPVYSFGMWLIGGKREVDTSHDDENIAILRKAMEHGVTSFDSAEGYAAGHSEVLLGRAINGENRKNLFISTKVGGEHQGYDDLIQSAQASLERLGTDYIDLYLLHSYPNPGIPIEDAMAAMDYLVDQKLVRNIGVSNMTPRRVVEAQKFTKHKIVYNQLHYNVVYREAEVSGSLEFCQQNDILLGAWRPLQKGAIPDTEIIQRIADKYNKTPNQVLLNWLVVQENVVALAKTSTLAHLEENLGALDWVLDTDDVEDIRKNFPDQQAVSDTYPLDYPGDIPA